MATATLTSKGQLTLPIELRTQMGLQAGSIVEFIQDDAGGWTLMAKNGDIRELKGIVRYDGPAVSIEDMEVAIMKAATADYLKSIS
jgi:antitoxin PrlF